MKRAIMEAGSPDLLLLLLLLINSRRTIENLVQEPMRPVRQYWPASDRLMMMAGGGWWRASSQLMR
jgi:hypothetical protein